MSKSLLKCRHCGWISPVIAIKHGAARNRFAALERHMNDKHYQEWLTIQEYAYPELSEEDREFRK